MDPARAEWSGTIGPVPASGMAAAQACSSGTSCRIDSSFPDHHKEKHRGERSESGLHWKTHRRKVAKTAADAVSREANAAAVGAADHPYTAAGLALAVGLLAFAIGYVMGRSSVASGQSYWR